MSFSAWGDLRRSWFSVCVCAAIAGCSSTDDAGGDTEVATSSDTGGAETGGDGDGDGDGEETSWRVGAEGFAVPTVETFYACFEVTVPVDALKHVVGFRPEIDPNSAAYVHHFVLTQSPGPSGDPQGSECYDLNGDLMWAWAPGVVDYDLPPEAGYLVGDAASEVTLRVQIHYNNPLGTAGVVDSSGVRVVYSDELRANNAGSVVFADVLGITIPPGEPAYKHVADCLPNQSEAMLNGPITVIGSMLHAHELGSVLWTDVYRQGEFVGELNRDDPFSFATQNYKTIDNFVIQPGDLVENHCVYDSTERTEPTYGGLGTFDEMCWNEMMYYPRENINFDLCGN